MEYTSLTVSTDDRLFTITLNRPERRNALDEKLVRELTEALSSANRHPASRIVILRGNGPAFCAGVDMESLQKSIDAGHEENLEDARNLVKLYRSIGSLKKPVIAVVHGPALGGGCGLAAVCDFVFAGKANARLGVPEVRLGFLPAIILPLLVKRMGEAGAKEFALRGDVLDALAAKERGLVTDVVEDGELELKVREFALTLARTASPSSLSLTKDLFVQMHKMSLEDATEYAANLNALARKTEDFKKGVNAFLHKEKLEW